VALGGTKTEAKSQALWPRVPLNLGRRGLYGFGSQPRPKAILFWPHPNILQFKNQCRILKTTSAKTPSCTGVVLTTLTIVTKWSYISILVFK